MIADLLLNLHQAILQNYRTQGQIHQEQAAQYAALAAEVSAQREEFQHLLRKKRDLGRKIYQQAREMLDIAIEAGDEESAAAALDLMHTSKITLDSEIL